MRWRAKRTVSWISLYNKTRPTPERHYDIYSTLLVYSISISKDGNYVAAGYRCISGNNRNTISFYNRTSSTALWKHSTKSSIRMVTLSSNGDYLVASEGSKGTTMLLLATLTTFPDPYNISSTVSIGKTFIYEIIEFNETLGTSLGISLTDIDATAYVGAQQCYEINNFLKTTNYWEIFYDRNEWGSDIYEQYSYGRNIFIHIDPKVQNQMFGGAIHPELLSIIPKPVDKYLERISWDSGSSSSAMSYSYEKTVGSYTFNLTNNFEIEGYLKSQIWIYNGFLLLNISYVGERPAAPTGPTSIPFGDSYLFFAFTTIALLIIVIKWRSKK